MDRFTLKNKTILVTGASSGIGAGVSYDLASMGANVIVSGRNKERLYDVFKSLPVGMHEYYVSDLLSLNSIDELVPNLPVLDGLVFCAGIVKTMPVRNIQDTAIEEIFQTNIMSSIQLCKRLLRNKKIAKGGSVVFISSVSTFNVKIGNSLYSATKGAVNSFAKAMALEVAPLKIRVNCIQPGFIQTGLLNSGIISQEQLGLYIAKHPLGLGTPSDISNGCIYLLSDASRWMTGSIITIDGGLTLQ